MNEDIIIFNTPEGRQDYLYFATGADRVYSLPSGSTVVWNSINMGEPRFADEAMLEYYGIYDYIFYGWDDVITVLIDQIGMWVLRYGPNAAGQAGTIPFIDGYISGSFSFIPEHKSWLLSNNRGLIQTFSFKYWLYDESVTLFNDVDAAVKATYATEPLNKIRWEHKEFMPYGGVIFNTALPIVQAFSPAMTDYTVFKFFELNGFLWYGDDSEDSLI